MQKTGTKLTPTAAIEPHFTVPELSKLLNLDPCAVRRMSQDEPSAVPLRNAPPPGKRPPPPARILEAARPRAYRPPPGAGGAAGVPAQFGACPACGTVGSK